MTRAHRSCLALAALVSMGAAAPAAAQTEWTVVSHEVSFEIRNAGLPVRGTFTELQAEVVFDAADPSSAELIGRIDPASIRTGIALRDRHLAGRQFFDVRRFPWITMRGGEVEASERPGLYRGVFDLEIRDVSKRIPALFRFGRDGARATLSGSITIDRVEFGVGDGGFLLDDEVVVTVELELAEKTGAG